eukprot:2279015-Prymnesium_polylepis.1
MALPRRCRRFWRSASGWASCCWRGWTRRRRRAYSSSCAASSRAWRRSGKRRSSCARTIRCWARRRPSSIRSC